MFKFIYAVGEILRLTILQTSFFIKNDNDYSIDAYIRSKNFNRDILNCIAGARWGYGVPGLSMDDNVTVSWNDDKGNKYSKIILISDYIRSYVINREEAPYPSLEDC